MKNLFYIFLSVILFMSCSKMNDGSGRNTTTTEGYTEYFIAKGSHYATGNGYKAVHQKSRLHFMAVFDSSCIYTSADPLNQGDINKLYGFSDCNTAHQENSARFGWNWDGKNINIYAYCYVNDKREWKLLGTVELNKPVDLSIGVQPNQYVFILNGTSQRMERNCSTTEIDGYQLYPYFGGDETAPHDMKINIKDLQE